MREETKISDEQKERKLCYWQKEETNFIKTNYGKMSGIEMANYINKNPPAIQWKLRKLGLCNPKAWSKQDIEFLKENRLRMNFDELARNLGRTNGAIHAMCAKLRLVRPQYNLELSMSISLAYILGCLCGDASILKDGIRLSVKDKDFAEEFNKHSNQILSLHFIKISNFESKSIYYVSIGSLAFKNFIIKNYGWLKTKDWKVPPEILNSSNKNIIRFFLKGFFDSEGNYHNCQIRVQSICPSLYNIGILLNKLNIDNRVVIVNRKTIAGNLVYSLNVYKEKNINLFKKQIGFSIQRKQIKLKDYLIQVNKTKYKYKLLLHNKKKLARLYKDGKSLQYIANMFNIQSPCALTPYIKSILKEDYDFYKCKHLGMI